MRAGRRPTIFFLAGGKGTRLRAVVSDRPKPMVEVAGRPFLYWLVRFYRDLGHDDFVMSTGHLAHVIEDHDWTTDFPGARFRFAREATPLGTGGAVAAAFADLRLDDAWIINADTLLPQPLPSMPEAHPDWDALYLALAAGEVFDAKPNLAVTGALVRDADAAGRGGSLFDGGAVYVGSEAVLRGVKAQSSPPYSLHQLLQPSMQLGRVGADVVSGTCYDIGTPERLARFEAYLARS